MDLISMGFIGVGLAMDAFAVSITSGLTLKKLKVRHALRIGFLFGLFQSIMPLVGWLAGLTIKNFIEGIDHWVAFILLAGIGLKMIYESFQLEEENDLDPTSLSILLIFSVATSIDALAVGISFSLIQVSILTPIIIIGIITFTMSFIGVYIGDKFGHLFENKIEILGGIILIIIGLKILLEHLLII